MTRRYAIPLLVKLSLFVTTTVFGQTNERNPVSPAMTTFSKFDQLPVNLFNGIPNISIPVYVLEVDGFTLPLTLVYHAGGFKVGEGASQVGLGWTLSGSGAITKIEMDRTGAPVTISGTPPAQDKQVVDGKGRSLIWHPDGTAHYYYPAQPKRLVSAPGLYFKYQGDTGVVRKFAPYNLARRDTLLKADGVLWFTNEKGIRYKFSAGLPGTGQGAAFDFVKTIYPSNFNVINGVNVRLLDNVLADRNDYLCEIRTLNNQSINFEYTAFPIINTSAFSETYYFPRNDVSPYYHTRLGGFLDLDQPEGYVNVKREGSMTARLDKIKCSNGVVVEFGYTTPRTDLVGDGKLSGITIYRINNGKRVVLRQVNLYHSYFETTRFEKRSADPVINSIFYRLKLDSLDIDGGSIYAPQRFKFEYNQNELPEKTSYAMDLWGYINGAPNQFLIPSRNDSVGPGSRKIKYNIPSGNRYADTLGPLSGLLTRIVNPLGGSTSFEYETNTVADNPYTAEWNFTGIPFAENVIEYPIVPKTVPYGNAGTERDDLYKTLGPYYFTIYSDKKLNGIYAKNCRFEWGYINGPTDASAFNIKVYGVSFDTLFTTQNTVGDLRNGIYKFYIENTSTAETWDWAKLRLVIKEPGLSVYPAMPAYNYRAAGARIKRTVVYDGRNHANDIVQDYKYHDLQQTSRSSGKLMGLNSVYTEEIVNASIPKYVFIPGSSGPLLPTIRPQFVRDTIEIGVDGHSTKVPSYKMVQANVGSFEKVEIRPEESFAHLLNQSFSIYSASTGYPGMEEDPATVGYSNVTVEFGVAGKYGKKEYVFNNTGPSWQRGMLIAERTYRKTGSGFEWIRTDSTAYDMDTAWARPKFSAQSSKGNLPGAPVYTESSWFAYGVQYLGTPSSTKTLQSNGDTTITNIVYPGMLNGVTGTDRPSEIVKGLRKLNVQTAAIESAAYTKTVGGSQKLIGASVTTFRPGSALPDSSFKIDLNVPQTTFSAMSVVAGKVQRDQAYRFVQAVTKYDEFGNPAEAVQSGGKISSTIWGYDGSLPVANVTNADSSSIAYSSFETGNQGNWVISGGRFDSSVALTGRRCFYLAAGASICRNALPASQRYVVTYWSRNGSLTVPGALQYSQVGSNGWTYYQHLLPVNVTSTCISGTNVLFDELRLYPEMALMETRTFEPGIGATSENSPSNKLKFFKYDPLGRLQLTLDAAGNVLNVYEYNRKK